MLVLKSNKSDKAVILSGCKFWLPS